MENTKQETFTVRVYREDAEWTRLESLGQQWFQMRADLLAVLHIADYVCSDNDQSDRELHIAELRAEHPNCVLVY